MIEKNKDNHTIERKSNRQTSQVQYFLLFALIMPISLVFAEIPEPINLIYGNIVIDNIQMTAVNTEVIIEARLAGTATPIARYALGSNQDYDDYFVLPIPVDAVGVQTPKTVRIGDVLQLYVSNKGPQDPLQFALVENLSIPIADRGVLLPRNVALSLGASPSVGSDLHGDGMSDEFERANNFNPNDSADAAADADNDGYTNVEEFLSNTNPLSPLSVPVWANYELRLDFSSSVDDAIGVIFRYQGPDHYYRFSWNARESNRRVEKIENGFVSVLAEDNSGPYVVDQSYQFRLVAQGDKLDVYIDGSPVFSVTHERYAVGGVAVYTNHQMGSYFDNITLVNLDNGHVARQNFSDPDSINEFTVVDKGNKVDHSNWYIENKILVQAAAIDIGTSLKKYDTFAIYDLRDRDNDTIPDAVDAFPDDRNGRHDSDNDGLPDAWEQQFGLNAKDANDADLDSDADGYTHLQEYQNQTDPAIFDKPAIRQSLVLFSNHASASADSMTNLSNASIATVNTRSSKIKTWDLSTGTQSAQPDIEAGVSNGIHAIYSDGKEIIIGTADATVQVWNVSNATKRHEFTSMIGSVLAVHMNEAYYIAGSTEGEIYIWYKDGQIAYQWNSDRLFISDIKIENNRVYLTSAQPIETSIWDLQGNLFYHWAGDDACCYFPALRVAADKLITTGMEKRQYISLVQDIRGDDSASFTTRRIPVHLGEVTSLAVSQAQQRMVSGDSQGNLYLWDLATLQLLQQFKAHETAVNKVLLTPKLAISTSVEGRLKMWSLPE